MTPLPSWIPEDIRRAAERAGLRTPLWYLGLQPPRPRKKTFEDLVADTEARTRPEEETR
jgi:hypothetical protein